MKNERRQQMKKDSGSISVPMGIVHFMAYPQGPVLETLGKLIDNPCFSLVEVTRMDEAVRRAAAGMFRAAGKTCAYGAQPCLLKNKLNLNDVDAAGRIAAVDMLKSCVDEAAELGAIAMSFLSGKDPGEKKREDARKLLAESVREVCEYARGVAPEMKVILETFDRVEFGKNALMGPTCEAVEFAKEIRKDYFDFSLLLDLSHLPLLDETPEEMLLPAKDFIGHIHVGNCVMHNPSHPAYGDEHPAFGIESGENGVEELAAFLRVLREVGYINEEKCGFVSFEVKPLPGQDSDELVSHTKHVMDEACAKIGINSISCRK